MSTLEDEIRKVLSGAKHGKNPNVRGFLTAYQIFHQLPERMRNDLVAQYATPGKNAGKPFSAASAVAKAMPGDVDVEYLDTSHMGVAPGDTEAGYPLCAVYRLKEFNPSTW
jgi:hypothetical protein